MVYISIITPFIITKTVKITKYDDRGVQNGPKKDPKKAPPPKKKNAKNIPIWWTSQAESVFYAG